MHFSSNKYRGRRNSFVSARNVRNGHNPRTFDPRFVIEKLSQQLPTTDLAAPAEYVSVHQFSDFKIAYELTRNISEQGFVTPTPIQDQTIPLILEGKDVVGIANTGTGKTAAFLIPLINKAVLNRMARVLIVTPTRELAVQIRDELVKFSKGLNIDSVLCIGGVSIQPQIQRLRRNPQFVIGTPGRLNDLERTRHLNFMSFNSIVLDEVDRMLDIGFVHEIKYIIAKLPKERHSLFFSATLPSNVEEIMRSLVVNPVVISVKSTDTAANVHQEVVKINGRAKVDVLHNLLLQEGFSKVLVFGRTKYGMEKIANELGRRGLRVASIHGNKNQNQRQRALNDFKNNQVQVLLATDVASRGIDVNEVTHVINYDLPETYENYIHRIGRTGRANKTGVALTFVD